MEQTKPYVRIIEQPASKALRFSSKNDKDSISTIVGVHSTVDKKTYPTIEVIGYKGEAVVVVSCVTENQPYRPHPNNLVGNKGCKKGVCTIKINPDTMRAVFSDLSVQCINEDDIDAALETRAKVRVDPFKTGFSHRLQPHNINLNAVRLCFQVIIEGETKGSFTQALEPVVTEPIYNLVICRLGNYASSAMGNAEVILLCGKVAKDDISVRFYEEQNGQMIWEAIANANIYSETAIVLKTPTYHTLTITKPVQVFIQLKQPSDGSTSVPLSFQYLPLSMETKNFITQQVLLTPYHCFSHFPRHKTANFSPDSNYSQLNAQCVAATGSKREISHLSDLTMQPLNENNSKTLNNLNIAANLNELKQQRSNNLLELSAGRSHGREKHSNWDNPTLKRTPLEEQKQRELVPRLLQSF